MVVVELPEWSKLFRIRGGWGGSERKEKKKSREEERGNKHKQNTHKLNEEKNSTTPNKKYKKCEKSRRALAHFSNLIFQKQESQKYFSTLL